MSLRFALSAVLLAGGPAAAAEQPTLDQLMATPSAPDIAAQWKAICLDHAGDAKAQKASVKASELTWPYQAYFLKDKGAPACVLASSIAASDTVDSLFAATEAAASPAALVDRKNDADQASASTVIEGMPYMVTVGIKKSTGNQVATVILTSLKKD